MSYELPDQSRTPESHVRICLRMSPAFKAWLYDFATTRDLTVADTIGQAIRREAAAVGFRTPPPR
jgi:hypothetical protein